MDDLFKNFMYEKMAEELASSMCSLKAVLPVIAAQLFSYYSELITAGFTEQQAMFLLSEHGIDAGKMLQLGGSM